MITLTGRNVNALWPQGMLELSLRGVEGDSRAGRVKVMGTPVMSVYERPTERVLMDPVRDANPFFHLMESLWMLAGREDAGFLNHYVSDFGSRFGDGPEENRFIHGAYGHRWRKAFDFDQLDTVVRKLRANPDDRQCVIQMWNADQGVLHEFGGVGCDDLLGDWKDRPCNTHVYLRLHQAARQAGNHKILDLTVCCRSNDIVWGAYGANAVHFSVLQEYLAGRLGVSVGRMYQFSNNYHGYVDVMNKFGDPVLMGNLPNPYGSGEIAALPMGSNWEVWDEDLRGFMRWHDWLWTQPYEHTDYSVGVANQTDNSWFMHTAVPMVQSIWLWKHGKKGEALIRSSEIDAPDWRAACVAWMQRRMK